MCEAALTDGPPRPSTPTMTMTPTPTRAVRGFARRWVLPGRARRADRGSAAVNPLLRALIVALCFTLAAVCPTPCEGALGAWGDAPSESMGLDATDGARVNHGTDWVAAGGALGRPTGRQLLQEEAVEEAATTEVADETRGESEKDGDDASAAAAEEEETLEAEAMRAKEVAAEANPETVSAEEIQAADASEAAEEAEDGVEEGPVEGQAPPPPAKNAFFRLFMGQKGKEQAAGGNPSAQGTAKKKNNKQRPSKKNVKNIVLVGNGKSNLKKEHGAKIDAMDLVGRFNFFKLKKFEKNVGTRTDLWFIGELRQPGPVGHRGSARATGRMDLKITPKRYIVPIVYPLPKRCSPKRQSACNPSKGDLGQRKKTQNIVKKAYGKYKLTDRLEIMPMAVQQALATKYHYYGTWPSTGILAIVYCLEKYPGAMVHITGYDFAHKALGHYWEKVRKKSTVHSMSAEGRFVNRLVVEGKVKHLV